jgi:hypothetical protein
LRVEIPCGEITNLPDICAISVSPKSIVFVKLVLWVKANIQFPSGFSPYRKISKKSFLHLLMHETERELTNFLEKKLQISIFSLKISAVFI